jgi:TonB family protein
MHAARLDRTGRRWPALAITLGALILVGCATPTNGPDPAAVIDPAIVASAPSAAVPGVGGARPRFFVQWKSNLPGLTRRPTVSEDTDPPEYPSVAVRDELAGVTTLETCVTVEGRLADIRVVQSSGFAILDAATLDWARAAKFLPAEINGEPFAVCGYRFDHVWQVNE